jgi:hypothetical protein
VEENKVLRPEDYSAPGEGISRNKKMTNTEGIQNSMTKSTKVVPRYVIVRSVNAGCFAGTLTSRNGDSVTLENSRRLWYWSGAASLSQLAVDGTHDPNNCKFPVAIPYHEVLGICEIIDVTDKARASIESVPIWKK